MNDTSIAHSARFVAHSLGNAQGTGGNWTARCPAHEDERNSLSLHDGDGKLLVHCFTGCTQEMVIEALRGRNLWPRSRRGELPDGAHYPYSSDVVVVRQGDGKSKRIRPYYRSADNDWKIGLPASWKALNSRPLYLVGDADASLTFVHEGEKSAEYAASAWPEYRHATWMGGASASAKTDFSALANSEVILVADDDAPGRKVMRRIAARLDSLGCDIRIYATGGKSGDDVVDWLAKDTDDVVLQRILDNAEPYERIESHDADPYRAGASGMDRETARGVAEVTGESVSADWDIRYDAGADLRASLPDGAWMAGGKPAMEYVSHTLYKWMFDDMGIDFRFNERSQAHEARGAILGEANWSELTDEYEGKIKSLMSDRYFKASRKRNGEMSYSPLKLSQQGWRDLRMATAHDTRTDPFEEYLENLPVWDGKSRLDTLLSDCGLDVSRNNPDLVAWASRFLPMGSVTRTLNPGDKLDEMPVLSGTQGIGKSTFGEWLLPDEGRKDWYQGQFDFAASTKAQVESVLGTVIAESGEMKGMRRADLAAAKQFMTTTTDRVRLSYRQNAVSVPRRNVWYGTTDDETPLPNDPAGNRRFVIVYVDGVKGRTVGQVRKYLNENRDQIWAEALYRVRSGEEARLPDALAEAQALANEPARQTDDTVEDALSVWLSEDRGEFTVYDCAVGSELISGNGDKPAPRAIDMGLQTRITKTLRLLGCVQTARKLRAGVRARFWYQVSPPSPEPEPSLPAPASTQTMSSASKSKSNGSMSVCYEHIKPHKYMGVECDWCASVFKICNRHAVPHKYNGESCGMCRLE